MPKIMSYLNKDDILRMWIELGSDLMDLPPAYNTEEETVQRLERIRIALTDMDKILNNWIENYYK